MIVRNGYPLPLTVSATLVASRYVVDRVKQAQESKVLQLMRIAITTMAYRTCILAWYDCPVSTGKVEGINNKIKVMKRGGLCF